MMDESSIRKWMGNRAKEYVAKNFQENEEWLIKALTKAYVDGFFDCANFILHDDYE